MVYGLEITKPDVKEELISFAVEHSVIDTGIVPDTEDQILTLSTCTSVRGLRTKRWVVQGVLAETYERVVE